MSAKTIARWVALGALFLVPLAPLIVANSFFFPFITGKAFYFRIIIEIAVAAWAVLALMDKAYRPRFSLVSAAVLAFVVWMFVADCFAVNVFKAFWSNYERMEGWVLLIHLLGFFVVASTVLRVEKQWRTWFLASLGVSVIVAFHALFQLWGLAAIHQGANRIDASFGNSAYLAIYFLFNTFLAGWLALTEKRAWLKYSLFVLAVVEAILIFYTETRGTIVGLAAGLVLAAFLAAVTGGKHARRFAVGALVVLVVLIGGFYLARDSSFVNNNDVLHRIASISPADGQVRFMIWHIAYEGFLASPVVGYGQEGFNYVFNKYYDPAMHAQEPWFDRAHNAFIDWLIAGGLPAFLLYLALFVTAIAALWRGDTLLSRSERIALTCALVGYAFHNLFVFDNLYSYVYFFAILALVDSQVGKPITFFERAEHMSESAAAAIALPIAGACLIAALWFVNYQGMADANELIAAISPAPDPSQNLATFQDLLSHPGFAGQEEREQLVSFASSLVNDQSAPDALKQQTLTFAAEQMQLQIQEHPGDARTVLELAALYRAGGDNTDALKAIQAASALSPGKEDIYVQEGATYWDSGDVVDANAAFQKAYALGPQFADLATYAAAGDFIVGDSKDAYALLEKTFGTTVVDDDVLALAYYRTKDYPDLIKLWQLRNSGTGATANTAFGLAAAYYLAGDDADAIATINAAIVKYPDQATAGAQLIQEIKSGTVQ